MVEQQPRVYPFREALSRLGLKTTKGHELIKQGPNGEPPLLESYVLGRFRYVTSDALQRFISARMAEAMKASPTDTAAKVRRAVEERQRKRAAEKQAAEKQAA